MPNSICDVGTNVVSVARGGLLYTCAVRKVKLGDGNKATLVPEKKGRGYVRSAPTKHCSARYDTLPHSFLPAS